MSLFAGDRFPIRLLDMTSGRSVEAVYFPPLIKSILGLAPKSVKEQYVFLDRWRHWFNYEEGCTKCVTDPKVLEWLERIWRTTESDCPDDSDDSDAPAPVAS